MDMELQSVIKSRITLSTGNIYIEFALHSAERAVNKNQRRLSSFFSA